MDRLASIIRAIINAKSKTVKAKRNANGPLAGPERKQHAIVEHATLSAVCAPIIGRSVLKEALNFQSLGRSNRSDFVAYVIIKFVRTLGPTLSIVQSLGGYFICGVQGVEKLLTAKNLVCHIVPGDTAVKVS